MGFEEVKYIPDIEFKGIELNKWLETIPENTMLKVLRADGITCLFEPISNAIYVVSETGSQPAEKK